MREALGLHSWSLKTPPRPDTTRTIKSLFSVIPADKDTMGLTASKTIPTEPRSVISRGVSYPPLIWWDPCEVANSDPKTGLTLPAGIPLLPHNSSRALPWDSKTHHGSALILVLRNNPLSRVSSLRPRMVGETHIHRWMAYKSVVFPPHLQQAHLVNTEAHPLPLLSSSEADIFTALYLPKEGATLSK